MSDANPAAESQVLTLAAYEERAQALLDAGSDADITLDDARQLVAVEHGFTNWPSLQAFVATLPSGRTITSSPMRVRVGDVGDVGSADGEHVDAALAHSRDWGSVLHALAANPGARLEAHGQMTDAMLEQLCRVAQPSSLQLVNCKALTDQGLRHLSALSGLRDLDLSQTNITDRGLAVLRDLPSLESLSLAMTRVTDEGVAHVAHCNALTRLNLMWTHTGDGAIRALAGKEQLTHFLSGNDVTNHGLAQLHGLPVFTTWRGADVSLSLMRYEEGPNLLLLRGTFSDTGLEQLRGLDGLFGLNLDDAALPLTARAMQPLVALPRLGRLTVDAKDDWMPVIAELPALRFLAVQDTTAGDDGFAALSQSPTLEYLWGRRCHNLGTRGFVALSGLPRLRGLSVSCLNVGDDGVAALPEFPALRELMPMDVPDDGYRHIGRCADLESLILMYCRDTTDAATEQITGLTRLKHYLNSYTAITDRTPALLATMDSLESITFDACHGLTNEGIAVLARLPRLREVRVAGRGVTAEVAARFAKEVVVRVGG